jgi:hypothetical protein
MENPRLRRIAGPRSRPTVLFTLAALLASSFAFPGAAAAQEAPPSPAASPTPVAPSDEPAAEPPQPGAADAPAVPAGAAGAKPTYEVRRATAPVVVDGVLDEATWSGAPTFTLDYETYPGDNVPAPVRTEYWVTFDDRHLYVGVRAHDPEPAAIRARLSDRDNAFRDDFVGIVLDTFNDERRAFEFLVNPLGVQMDMFQNDVSGGEDVSWDALWASGGRITAGGYEVEMAIPFSSLRFPRVAGAQTWGVDAMRIWPRDQRRRMGLSRQERGRNCYLCQASKLHGIEGITPGRNIELDPTLTAHQTEVRPEPEAEFESESEVDPGLTARWGVTPGITLNAAVNPDFSQVEADAAQLDVNTQFALFFPEKRPFFLEGADLFETRIGAVYTRNIADPDWGFKVSGKQGRHGFGALIAGDTQTNLLLPGSQGTSFAFLDQENTSAVLRYRTDLGESSYVGGLFTDREGTGYHNRLAGIDSLMRWGEGNAFRIEALGSNTRYPDAMAADFGQPQGDFDGFAVRAVYQRTTEERMQYVMYNEVSADFRADLGFIPQADYRKGYGIYERYHYGEEGKDWYTRWTWAAESTFTYDHDGNPLQRQVSPYFWFNGPRQSFVQVYLGLGDSFFAGRSFDRNFLVAFGEMQLTPIVFLSLDSRVGQEIDYANARDGDIVRVRPLTRLELGRHLRLELSDFHETLDVEGGQLYRVDLAELRATYQLNVRSFVRLITQYEDIHRTPELYTFPVAERSRDVFNQLLFSYKLNPQTVFFLGYSDRHFGGAPGKDWLSQSDRTVFAKVGYAFVW